MWFESRHLRTSAHVPLATTAQPRRHSHLGSSSVVLRSSVPHLWKRYMKNRYKTLDWYSPSMSSSVPESRLAGISKVFEKVRNTKTLSPRQNKNYLLVPLKTTASLLGLTVHERDTFTGWDVSYYLSRPWILLNSYIVTESQRWAYKSDYSCLIRPICASANSQQRRIWRT